MRPIPLSAYALTIVVLAMATLGAAATLPPRNAHGRLIEPHLTASGARAYELLALSDTFAYEREGNGFVSAQACAVQTLLREPRAAEAFRALYREPSLIAKLYGLVGIWHRDPGQFDRNLDAIGRSHADVEVPTVAGCIRSRRTVREVLYVQGAAQVAAGTPSSEIALPDEFMIDVSGGLVSLMLAYAWGCDGENE